MKKDYAWPAVIIGVLVLIVGIFFEELLFGLELPIEILALSFTIYAFYVLMKNEKKSG